MADNIAVTPGAGTTIAADDVGGVLHQRVKISIGADGSAADLVFGQGAMAASLPVTIANNQSALPVTGTFYQTTQPVSGTVAVSGLSGSVAVTGTFFQVTQPVSASALPLPTGAATETTLAAVNTKLAGTIATSLASQPLPTGASTETTLTALSGKLPATLGVKTSAASLSVAIASDDALAVGSFATITTTVTRPADSSVYAANDVWADSTSAPTAGGFTLTGASRSTGLSGLITDIMLISSNDPATLLQGELWIFDSAGTAINDNAAFALSDTDALKLVAVVPFSLITTVAGSGTNSYAHLQNLSVGFTCVGTADLRFLVKVKNAYTPASAETLTVRAKIQRAN